MAKRKTVSAGIKAEVIYPAFGSKKSATTEYVNFDLARGGALDLAVALVNGSQLGTKVTVRINRKKNLFGEHPVTVTVVD